MVELVTNLIYALVVKEECYISNECNCSNEKRIDKKMNKETKIGFRFLLVHKPEVNFYVKVNS